MIEPSFSGSQVAIAMVVSLVTEFHSTQSFFPLRDIRKLEVNIWADEVVPKYVLKNSWFQMFPLMKSLMLS